MAALWKKWRKSRGTLFATEADMAELFNTMVLVDRVAEDKPPKPKERTPTPPEPEKPTPKPPQPEIPPSGPEEPHLPSPGPDPLPTPAPGPTDPAVPRPIIAAEVVARITADSA